LDRERSTALFRIFQEALTNICRHAEATRVRVDLSARDGELVTTVTDNGKGITEEQISDSGSLGLIGMRERVRPLGGEVDISSLPDGGTCVRVRMPLDAREKEKADDTNPHCG
jgi:two-component system sensor histidine kinase UhpB